MERKKITSTAIMRLTARVAASLLAVCVTLASIGLVEFGPLGASDPVSGPGGEPVLEAVELFENYIAPSAGLDIKAEAADGNNCIAEDTGFLLSLSEPLEEKYIRQWLKASPEFDYTLEKNGRKGYRLKPKQAFEKNTLYTLSFDPLQTDNGMPARAGNNWAFQTRKGFAMERTFPWDEGTGVPVNSAIELTFSGDVKLADLKKHVSFSPQLGGSDWRKTGMNTYSFLASGGEMQADTVYEVRVSGALGSALGGETLGEDRVFRFRTEAKGESFWSNVGPENNAFMTTEKPAFSLWFHPQHEGTDIPAQVFRFESLEAYAGAADGSLNYDAWSGKEKPALDTAALEKVFDGKIELLGDEGSRIAVLPQALPGGFYAAQFTTNGHVLTSLFQVTDLSAYAVSGGGDCLFWLNDLATALPAAGAEISRAGGAKAGTTDARGILTFKNADASGRYTAYRAQKGEDQLLVMLYNGGREEGFNGQDYWKYIYADKRLYTPGDTLKFFGVAAPKQQGTKAIDKVTAVIERSYWDSGSEIKAEVPVKNGVYEGEIQLPELPPDYYSLSLYYGEERLGSTYFEVRIYKKPACSLSLSVDKPIIWAGEQVTVTAAATYFDGTPTARLDLALDGKSVQTDGFGKVSAKVSTGGDTDRLISSRSVSAEAELPEIGRVYEHTYAQCVNSDVEIQASAKRDGDATTLEVQAFAVDFSGLDTLDWYNDSRCLKDFGGSLELAVSWTHIIYTKVSDGKRYDPYTKTYTESFRYNRSEKLEGSKTIAVKGKDKQGFDLPLAAGEEYSIKIEGKDTKGRAFRRETYVYDVQRRSYDYGRTVYVRDNNGKDAYAVGDKVSLSAYENYGADSPIELEKGAVLFLRASDKFIDCAVSQENLYEFTFDGSVLPNINIYGVLFDGREYVEHYYPYSACVDTGSRALHLDVTPDKASYQPGETAKLSLRLTGPDRRPVQGTVNLNMVDEALLALREQYADIAEIFWDTYRFSGSTAISHTVVRNMYGGEKGDGEGEGDRSDFRDTALFVTAQTDSKGLASVEVKLPDNITSWRLFWQAFRPGDVLAGSGRANIIVTLPFFVDIRLGDTFLAGDKPVLGIRNAGTALRGGEVRYTVEIPSLQFSKTANAPTSVWYEMPLPALTAGEHSISVAAEYNGHKDKITAKFTVADGIADHTETETALLSGDLRFDIPAKGTARLVFADKQKAQVMRALWGILGTGSIRAEQLIAKQAAEDILASISSHGRGWYGGADYAAKIPQYQRDNGGIAPFTYGDVSDYEVLATTAWACALLDGGFSKPAAAGYLYRQLGGGETEALALLGLAALKEPVMQHISDAMERGGPPERRMLLALAQVFIGNGSAAKAMVREIIGKSCKTAKGGQGMYVDGGGREEVIRNTANLAVAAALLDLPEGGPLFQYVLENEGIEDPCLLQRVLVLRHKAQSVNPECASFKYTLGGEEKQVSLFLGYSLLLTAQQLRDIRFSDVSDEIEATASYTAPGFPKGKNKLLSVSAKYEDVNMAQQGVAKGEITFHIGEDTPDGYYDIVHVLPAGLEFSGMLYGGWNGIWVSEVKGQQVTFTVRKYGKALDKSIDFYARPVMTRSFRSEGTYITNALRPEFTKSAEGGIVTIK